MTSDNQPHHGAETRTDKAAAPVGAYPHARRVGNLLFLSGIGPRQAVSNEIPGLVQANDGTVVSYDIEAQCHAVFANIKAVLEASGATFAHLVDVTVFLTNMKEDFKAYNAIYAEYFKEHQPCRTTVEVTSLPTPIAIELKCIAAFE
jgi:2-aminomuconate deaminase